MAPGQLPIGLLVGRTAKALTRAYDDALAAVGGSAATWQVLSSLKNTAPGSHRELAEAMGIRQPTLTHHLDGMERAGLVTRAADPGNRRVQRIALTDAGEQLFLRLRRAAAAFDGRLKAGLDDDEVAELRRLLAHLVENSQPD
ncbi:MarR family winged helix-turn-helix transcriptional regulator [Geodermatophilus sp. SYSU D00691]